MEALFAKIGSYGWVLATAFFGVIYKDHKDRLLKQEQKIEELQSKMNNSVTKSEVREMIAPVISDQKDMKADLKNVLAVVTKMSEEVAVLTALREHGK